VTLGIFRDGVLIETLAPDPPTDPAGAAYNRLRVLAGGLPSGYEVLRICPNHPERSVVDCEDCDPEETP
jgi:hypothetical protein